MPTPTIPDGKLFFNAVTWTGNGTASGRSITGVGFQPDFVWGKARSVAYGHGLYDVARGTGKLLVSNNTNAEATNFLYGYLSSFDSNGFTTTAGSSSNENWNQTSDTYVAWNWKAGGAAVTNTAGSISSQVSANPTAGFSVVTFTGNSTGGATVGHGCQVNGIATAPVFYIVKQRTTATATSWYCYSKYLDTSSPQNYAIYLNLALGRDPASVFWNNTAPTDTVFSLGTSTGVNASGGTYVAYCWAEVPGYSKFGSFTGNGLVDGPFVYLGFRPAFFMVKRTDGPGSDWFMLDDQRPTFNVIGAGNGGQFPANLSYAESTLSSYPIADFLSNGIKVRGDMNVGYWTASGGTYIYMAFAENPFKYANAR